MKGPQKQEGKPAGLGTEFSTRLNPIEWLSIRGDITYTHAEFLKTGDSVPLAPQFTAFSSVTARLPIGLSGTLQMLTVGSRAGTEDNQRETGTIYDFRSGSSLQNSFCATNRTPGGIF